MKLFKSTTSIAVASWLACTCMGASFHWFQFQGLKDLVQPTIDTIVNTENSDPVLHIKESKKVPGDSPVEVCDAEYDQLLDIQYVNIDPNPPARGQNLTIEASGLLQVDIEEGAYVEVDVRYGYIRLIRETIDLCEQLVNVNMSCPIKAGQLDLTKVVELPDEIPPGKYLAFARAYTGDDEFITCLSASVEFTLDG